MSSQLTPRWSSAYLAALATAAVPGLDVVATIPPRLVTETQEATGVRDTQGRTWLVRAPRDDAAGATLLAEAALLRALADEDLPFEVAVAVGTAPMSEGGRAIVQRVLPGEVLDVASLRPGPGIAASVGQALAALHELGWEAVDEAGLPVYDAAGVRNRLLTELDSMAGTGRVPSVLLKRWEAQLDDVRLWRFRPTAVHGDLSGDCVRVSGEQVVALEDFASAHVGDPASDLGWLVAAAPEDALDSVLEAYALGRTEGGDAGILDRAQFHSEFALGRWLLQGIRAGSEPIAREAEVMLNELATAIIEAGER